MRAMVEVDQTYTQSPLPPLPPLPPPPPPISVYLSIISVFFNRYHNNNNA